MNSPVLLLMKVSIQFRVSELPITAAKCAFCEADMRRAHALLKPERAICRDARVSERDSANATRDCGIICS